MPGPYISPMVTLDKTLLSLPYFAHVLNKDNGSDHYKALQVLLVTSISPPCSAIISEL